VVGQPDRDDNNALRVEALMRCCLILRSKSSRRRDSDEFGSRSMVLSKAFDDAFVYAAELHRNQLRKGSGIPYIAHLMSVSSRVLSAGGTEAQAIAGLLHDAAEDQGGEPTLQEIRRRFGPDVERIVFDCTDAWETPKPDWRPRKEAYLASLPSKPKTSLLVSLADKLDNAEAILNDYRVLGEELWSRFKGKRNGTIWYYRTLSTIFAKELPSHPLSIELTRIVSQFPDADSGSQSTGIGR